MIQARSRCCFPCRPGAVPLCLALLCLLLSSSPKSSRAQESPASNIPSTFSQAFDAVQNSVAAVALFQGEPGETLPENADEYKDAFEIPPEELVPSRLGGGVILSIDDASGTVNLLTPAHLLYPAVTYSSTKPFPTRIVVRLACAGLHFAHIRATDPHSDLAVITVVVPDQFRSQLAAAQFTKAPRWSQGDSALLCGNPRQFFRTGLTTPCAIMVSRTAGMPDSWERRRWSLPLFRHLQRWDGINVPGDTASGDSVFTVHGELVGISSDIMMEPDQFTPAQCVLYCVAPVQKQIDDLQKGYEVQYGDTGLELETISSRDHSSQQAPRIRVLRVLRGSSAERAGIRSGDIIQELNGKEVRRTSEILNETLFLSPGTEIEMLIHRSGAALPERISFRLSKLDFPSRFPAVSTVDRWVWRGLSVDFSTPIPTENADLMSPHLPSGVLIRKVRKGSAGEAAGLKEGQLIAKVGEQPVETPEEFESALQYWGGLVPLTLDDGREIQVDVDELPSQNN